MNVGSDDQKSKEEQEQVKQPKFELDREQHKHETEVAVELAALPGIMKRRELNLPEEDRPPELPRQTEEEHSPSRTIGWLALTLAIMSLFLSPIWLGISAIVLGITAYVRGTRALGTWSVIIGGISALSYIFFIPS